MKPLSKTLFLLVCCVYLTPSAPSQENPFQPSKLDKKSSIENDQTIRDLRGNSYCDQKGCLLGSGILIRASELSINQSKAQSFVLRVTIKPTFLKPIVFRLTKEDQAYNLSVRRLSGLGGYEIGHVELISEISISEKEATNIIKISNEETVNNLSKLTAEQREAMGAQDGILYTVEIFSHEKLKVIDVYTLNLEKDATGLSPFLTKDAISILREIIDAVFTFSGIAKNDYF